MRKLLLSCAIVGAMASAASADEVEDTLNAALDAYTSGDLQYALDEIAYATQLINELKAQGLSGYLPAAIPPWTMVINDEPNASLGFLGGGVAVEAEYTNGSDSFTISMMADNQMVASMSGILGNSNLMASMGAIERINRQSFLNQDGDLSTLVGNRVLIQANGDPLQAIIDHLATVDYRDVEDFGR